MSLESISKSFKRIISVMLSASFLMPLCSCRKSDEVFPDIGNPTVTEASISEIVADTDTVTNQDYSFCAITVALPYSQYTVDYLSKLYYAKLTGQLGDRTGLTIELDALDAINTPWYINSIQTSYVGVSVDNLNVWQESDLVPDIYLAEDIDSVIENGYAVPLEAYLADNELFSASNIYLNALEECTYEGSIYGIPHYATSVMIAANMDYLPESGVLTSGYTWNDLVGYLTGIKARFENTGIEVVPFADASRLVPYLANCIDGNTHNYMLYEESDASAIADSVISNVTDLYNQTLSSGSDLTGNDPRYTRVAGMWLINSNEMDYWNSYYSNSIYYLPMPSYSGEVSSPYLTIYPICLSNNSENSDFAADFAAFITLDCDAQLLIRRLESQTGYIPMSSNPSLWMSIMDETSWGRALYSYESLMNSCIYCPGNNASNVYSSVNSYISSYFAGVEEGLDEEFVLSDCYGG